MLRWVKSVEVKVINDLTLCLLLSQVPSPQNAITSRARKQTSQPANGSETDEPVSTSESDGAREDEVCTPSTLQINEEMQRMLTQL